MKNIQDFYEKDEAQYQKMIKFNDESGCKINTIPKVYAGFCSFWRDPKKPKDSENYIASGLTIFMKKVSKKPKIADDYQEGIKQAMIMDTKPDIAYEKMFMNKGNYVLADYKSPSTRPTSSNDASGLKAFTEEVKGMPLYVKQTVEVYRENSKDFQMGVKECMSQFLRRDCKRVRRLRRVRIPPSTKTAKEELNPLISEKKTQELLLLHGPISVLVPPIML